MDFDSTFLKVKKSALNGKVAVPPSKSHTLRAIAFASLAKGKSFIFNVLPSPDTEAMIRAWRSFGAKIKEHQNHLEIDGLNGHLGACEDVINCGNSGQVLRFVAALSSLSTYATVFTGDYSIRNLRPVKPLLDGLNQLGVKAFSLKGNDRAPIFVQGPFTGGKAIVDGQDSQPISGLLMAAAFSKGPTEISVINAGEKPWINLTLSWLDRLHIPYLNQNFESFKIKGHSVVEGFSYSVPGDFSSAAFPIVAALITNSELTLGNVDRTDVQGDKKVLSLLEQMGAIFEYNDKEKILRIKKHCGLRGISVDINDFIDAIAILAVLGCYCEGQMHLYNARIARYKECDRIACIVKQLRAMGATIEELEDGLIVSKSDLRGAKLDSHDDHRLAMALTVAGLGAQGETSIGKVQCIKKSYPSFIQHFNKIGAHLDCSSF